jgi:hypothetical protein
LENPELVSALAKLVSRPLAEDLVDQFLLIRQDVLARTLGRSAPGKFVETFVQILEYIDTGTYSLKPSVDAYLQACENKARLDEGLRLCAARIARIMYSLRNKRSIVHKGSVDTNVWDLQFLLASAQWILTELLRLSQNISMAEAGKLVAQIQIPVGGLVQDFGDCKLVLSNSVTVRQEILCLMLADYPNAMTVAQLQTSMNRRPHSSVVRVLNLMWKQRVIHKNTNSYILTGIGLQEARSVYAKLAEALH